jgi:hypothetical protein
MSYYPCFIEYETPWLKHEYVDNDDDIMDCQEYANPKEIWDCDWLTTGGHWHDCPYGNRHPHCADFPEAGDE